MRATAFAWRPLFSLCPPVSIVDLTPLEFTGALQRGGQTLSELSMDGSPGHGFVRSDQQDCDDNRQSRALAIRLMKAKGQDHPSGYMGTRRKVRVQGDGEEAKKPDRCSYVCLSFQHRNRCTLRLGAGPRYFGRRSQGLI